MPVRLIIGPSGSGKTTRLLDTFKQFTSSEQESSVRLVTASVSQVIHLRKLILSDPACPGLIGDPVCTLTRFTTDILSRSTNSIPSLATDGQRLLIANEVVRSAENEWLRAVQHGIGIGRELVRSMGVMSESGVRPGDIRNAASAADLPPKSRRKLMGLAHMRTLCDEALSARGVYEPERLMRHLVEEFTASPETLQQMKCVMLDGLAELSPAERELVQLLAEHCEDVVVALDHDDRFSHAEPTMQFLMALPAASIERLGVGHSASALSHVKRHLFADLPAKVQCDPGIRVFTAFDSRMQVEMVAREIRRLVREDGLRYSDVAVVTRSMRGYAHILSIMEEQGVSVAADILPLSESGPGMMVLRWLDEWEGAVTHPRSELESLLLSIPVPEDDDSVCEHYAACRAIRRLVERMGRDEEVAGRGLTSSEFADLLGRAIGRGVYRLPGEVVDGVVLCTAGSLGGRMLRAVFVLDVVDGVFPRRPREDPLINDWERRALNAYLPHPLPTSESFAVAERRLFLSVVGSAQDRLYLCRIETGGDTESAFLDDMDELFVEAPSRVFGEYVPRIEWAETAKDLVARTVLDCCESESDETQHVAAVSYNLLLDAAMLGAQHFDKLGWDYGASIPMHLRRLRPDEGEE